MTTRPPALLRRLHQAMLDRDLEALAACFAPDYRNETPLHPAQNFTGREQVRRNWTRIFATVPDLTPALVRWAVHPPGAIWAEWDWRGTRADGGPLHLAGVTVLGADDPEGAGETGDESFRWSRFYMEPVEDGGIGVDTAVRTTVDGVR